MQIVKRILCVTDLSEVSKNAEIAALRLRTLLGAHLTILSCGEYYSHSPNNYFDDNLMQVYQDLSHSDEYLKFVEQKRLETIEHIKKIAYLYSLEVTENIEYEVKLENEVTATIDIIEERGRKFDLIVVGNQQPGFWERLLFSSSAKEICDGARLSTLLMPADDKWNSWMPKNIVVGSSLDDKSEFAEEFSGFIASKLKSQLTLLHVLDNSNLNFNINISHVFPIDYTPPQIQLETASEIKNQCIYQIRKIEQKIRDNIGITNVKTCIEIGKVGDRIVHFLQKPSHPAYDLLVIGSRGENALKKFFLGSKTDDIEEHCTIPLLVVQKNTV